MKLFLSGSVNVAIIDISIAIMVTSLKPWLLVPFAILMILALMFRKLYLRTAKYIRMLEGAAKSPVIQHIGCTLNGLSTIRAFKQGARFNDTFNIYQNDHCSAYFMYLLGKKFRSIFVGSLSNTPPDLQEPDGLSSCSTASKSF